MIYINFEIKKYKQIQINQKSQIYSIKITIFHFEFNGRPMLIESKRLLFSVVLK